MSTAVPQSLPLHSRFSSAKAHRRAPLSANALLVRFLLANAAILILLGAALLTAQSPALSTATQPTSANASTKGRSHSSSTLGKGPAASSLNDYLASVHALSAGSQPEPGSIWTENGRLDRFTADVRAMQPLYFIYLFFSD